MTTKLLIAPGAAGKTTWLCNKLMNLPFERPLPALVIVPTLEQIRAVQRRMVMLGGLFNVHVMGLSQFIRFLAQQVGCYVPELSSTQKRRIIQRAISQAKDQKLVTHYLAICDTQGFVEHLASVIDELKGCGISAETFNNHVSVPRLRELGILYAQYEQLLADEEGQDHYGIVMEVTTALKSKQLPDYPLIAFDGFDQFQPVQLQLLTQLDQQMSNMIVLMTGDVEAPQPRSVHKLFGKTSSDLATALNIQPRKLLPDTTLPPAHATLQHLRDSLFEPHASQVESMDQAIMLSEGIDRAHEVQLAMRWLKRLIVENGWDPQQTALISRSMETYLPDIRSTARRFGIPLRIVGGLPLTTNAVIQTIVQWLKIVELDEDGKPKLMGLAFVDLLRSPLLDWQASVGLSAENIRLLATLARTYQVHHGEIQWSQALTLSGNETLQHLFPKVLAAICPPTSATWSEWVQWLTDRIGTDDEASQQSAESLHVFPCVRKNANTAPNAIAALARLLSILEEMSEDSGEIVPFTTFVQSLEAAINRTTFTAPGNGVLIMENSRIRGVPVKALAVLGMAEGEIPRRIRDDPFLRDQDRKTLEKADLPIRLRQSSEREYFYETITRPSNAILFTRPILTDDGRESQPSPYWIEIQRLVKVEPVPASASRACLPSEAVSEADYLQAIVATGGSIEVDKFQANRSKVNKASLVPTTSDKAMSSLATTFGEDHTWSLSRIERYYSCPRHFFVQYVLKLQPEPQIDTETPDPRTYGNIVHQILETVFKEVDDPNNQAELQSVLTRVLGELLENAPEAHLFQPPPWWRQKRREIINELTETVNALFAQSNDYMPIALEKKFDNEPIMISEDEKVYLTGYIDRIDQNTSGQLRIVDYKTSASFAYTKSSLKSGKHLQLPLYALVVQEGLRLGQVAEGFYWHVKEGKASMKLTTMDGGVVGSFEIAKERLLEAIQKIRQGHFPATPPEGGCPDYCPAIAFCDAYQPHRRFG